jgi:hypothetical protein
VAFGAIRHRVRAACAWVASQGATSNSPSPCATGRRRPSRSQVHAVRNRRRASSDELQCNSGSRRRLPHGDLIVSNLRRWSASPPTVVTIPPGRSAVVQSNFLMGHCEELGPQQVLTVNRAIVVDYRASNHADREQIAQPSARIILTRGPTIRQCLPPRHSIGLVALDVSCKIALTAALGCRRFSYGHSGACSAAGYDWECTSTLRTGSGSLERCWLGSKRQSLKIRWTD